MGDFKEVKTNFVMKRKAKKKTPVTTKKTGVTFEAFGNIETIKQNIIRSGKEGQTWASQVVYELLPYTAEIDRVKELERENNELRENADTLEIKIIELTKENEVLKMRNDLQNKTIKEVKAKEKQIALFLLANYDSFKYIE